MSVRPRGPALTPTRVRCRQGRGRIHCGRRAADSVTRRQPSRGSRIGPNDRPRRDDTARIGNLSSRGDLVADAKTTRSRPRSPTNRWTSGSGPAGRATHESPTRAARCGWRWRGPIRRQQARRRRSSSWPAICPPSWSGWTPIGCWRRRARRCAISSAEIAQTRRVRAVGEMASGIVHDFNNCLTTILGFAELALGAARGSDPFYTDLTTIRTAALDAAALVRRLQTLGRPQGERARSARSRPRGDRRAPCRGWRSRAGRGRAVRRRDVRDRGRRAAGAAGLRRRRGNPRAAAQSAVQRRRRDAVGRPHHASRPRAARTAGADSVADEGVGMTRGSAGAAVRAVLHDEGRTRLRARA